MEIDMWIDKCTDMWMDMWIDKCTDMWMDMWIAQCLGDATVPISQSKGSPSWVNGQEVG